MVCMDTLFYRKDDQAVARVQTIQQLYDAIGPRKTQALLPSRDEGVIADFSLNNEMKYYNILQDHTGKVVPVQAMENIQEDAMQYLKELYAMTGTATGRYDDGNEFMRAEWFAQGHGRALYAYPEAMSAIVRLGQGDDTDVKAISSCEHPDVATAYVDYVSISSRIPADKVEAAKKLTALLTSKPYMLAALNPASKEDVPQYLLAARQDVMQVTLEQLVDEHADGLVPRIVHGPLVFTAVNAGVMAVSAYHVRVSPEDRFQQAVEVGGRIGQVRIHHHVHVRIHFPERLFNGHGFSLPFFLKQGAGTA